MSVFAIVHPTGLVGQEIRELLGRNPESWSEVRLLTSDETEVGNLTDIGGKAAMVTQLDEEGLRGVEVAFFCGVATESAELAQQLDPGAVAVLTDSTATLEVGRPVVHGVNSADLAGAADRLLLNPHPGVLLLSHLVHPLLELGLTRCNATLIMPTSISEKQGLDELFAQARQIVAMVQEREQAVFGRQLAFSLYPDSVAPGQLTQQLRALFPEGPAIAAQTIQAGVFHGLSASVHVTFSKDPGLSALQEALAASPRVEINETDQPLSPIDSAARAEVLLDDPQTDGHGGYWLWAVMDNLVLGAQNALGVARAALRGG